MRVISGTVEGHSAATKIGIGFLPDRVEYHNITSGVAEYILWNRNFRLDAAGGGVRLVDANDDCYADLASRSGINLYEGGDIITTAAETHKVKNPAPDYRADTGGTGTITTFTMDTIANFTGHFDQGFNTTYVGAGSKVIIDGQVYNMVAVSNDGNASDEVELDRAPSGDPGNVTALFGMYDYIAATVGTIMPAGFEMSIGGEYWKDSEMGMFTAWKF